MGAPRIPLLGLCSHVSIVIKTYTSSETGEQDLDNWRTPEHIGEKQGNSLEARRTERGQRDRDRERSHGRWLHARRYRPRGCPGDVDLGSDICRNRGRSMFWEI